MRPGSELKVAEEEEEEEVVVVVVVVEVVVDSIDGPYEAWGCVIYWFLVKFADVKKVVTDGPTDRSTDGPTDGLTDGPTDGPTDTPS